MELKRINFFINLHIVPLFAVLMCFIGFINGGLENLLGDTIIYIISFLLSYIVIYVINNLRQDKIIQIISALVYLIIIFLYTYFFNKLQVLFLSIVFIHLLFFTKRTKINSIDDIKSFLSYTYSNLPILNKIAIAFYLLILFINIYTI
jgi:hypothetical protein